MEKFVDKPIRVPFSSLFLDPNNPRLGRPDGPGYDDPEKLFDKSRQAELEQALSDVYDVDTLVTAIEGQGWLSIDNMVVWTYPGHAGAHIVVEGNTRTLALRRIRGPVVERERKKLQRMEEGGNKRYAEHDIQEQRELVKHLERVVADTNQLEVVPLAATTLAELHRKLPRVLAVRHITGVKPWGGYAEDLWLLRRYEHLFEDKHTSRALFWDQDLIKRIADEASLSPTEARRKLRAASSFSHFKREYEDELPNSGNFEPTDYYVFENIVKKPFLRAQFGLGEDDRNLSSNGEAVLFEWLFKKPRGKTADTNENIFYRQENVLVWDQMKRYDDDNLTTFASRFDVTDYKNAPLMREVEADFWAHKARKKPQAVIDDLLRRLRELPVESLLTEGEFLRRQLEQLHEQSKQYLRMLDAAVA